MEKSLSVQNHIDATSLLLGLCLMIATAGWFYNFATTRRPPPTQQTSFPDLPFKYYGDAVRTRMHSSATESVRRCPRTDLETLTPWTSFPNDIHQAILRNTRAHSLTTTPFHLDVRTRDTNVQNEAAIRTHATTTLLEPATDVLEKLGVNGSFALLGGGNIAMVGDPDFSWITSDEQPHPKLIVEYKTWWAADLALIVEAFRRHQRREKLDTLSKQSLDALEQIYGYMSFNNNRFGILTNWKHALFLRRAETPNRKTLQYFLLELNRDGRPLSMLKAVVGMVLLAEDDWFYASPIPSSVPGGRLFGTDLAAYTKRREAVSVAHGYDMRPINGAYPCQAIDFCILRFDLSSARRGANGCTVTALFVSGFRWGSDFPVVCKVVDAFRYPAVADYLESEARIYAALRDLQGKVIPKLHGFYQVWGILVLLALEDVGEAISENEEINQGLRDKMRAALRRIHDAGYIHGDIARRNFCRKKNGDVFLVDFETCRLSVDLLELVDEMEQVDML